MNVDNLQGLVRCIDKSEKIALTTILLKVTAAASLTTVSSVEAMRKRGFKAASIPAAPSRTIMASSRSCWEITNIHSSSFSLSMKVVRRGNTEPMVVAAPNPWRRGIREENEKSRGYKRREGVIREEKRL